MQKNPTPRMGPPRSVKQEFLKKWILGLQACNTAKQNMSILERKKAIKLSADIAMASTRNGSTYWSQALVAKAARDHDNKLLVEHILTSSSSESDGLKKAPSIGPIITRIKRVRSKKILKKSRQGARRVRSSTIPQMVVAKSLATRIVEKRTQVLKSLVPGGEFMDDISLIGETLDYIVALRAQVNVMRTLAKATELQNANRNIKGE